MEPRMLLSRLLDLSKRAGAQAAEVLYKQSSELALRWERGSVGLPRQHEGLEARVGVWLSEGRQGWCDLGGADPEQLLASAETKITAAIERASSASPSPLAGPVDRYDIVERGLGLFDRRWKHLGMEDRRDVLEDNVQGCRNVHPDIRVERLSYLEQIVERGYASSRGNSAVERSSRYEATMRARLGRNGRRHVERAASRQFANVASMPFGVELGQRILRLTTRATIPTGEPPLIIDAIATAQLARSLAPAFAAPAVHSSASFVGGCFGERIAAPKLHLIDDPALPGALYSRAFDDRGVPPVPVVLLREGVASGLYLDPPSARSADLRPTGHFMGGALRPSNLVLRPGNRSRNAIGMDLNDYVVISGFHAEQPVDLATGTLDSPVDLLVYRDHAYVGAVEGVRLRMPIADFLGAVVEIASDQARYAEVDASSLVLEGIGLGQ